MTVPAIRTLLAVSLLSLGLAPGASAQELAPRVEPWESIGWVPGVLLVRFSDSVADDEIESVTRNRGSEILARRPGGYHALSVPAGVSVFHLARQYAVDAGCEWAAPDLLFSLHGKPTFAIPPDDPAYASQTHLHLIDVERAWRETTGDASVVVAVIDSGVAYEDRLIPDYELRGVVRGVTRYLKAPDLIASSFKEGADIWNGDDHANDDFLHGTAVAATISQDTGNGHGAAGIAPDVTIMPIKVGGPDGVGTLGSLIDAIAFATEADVDVVNMSLGFPDILSLPFFDPFFTGLDDVLAQAHDAGIVLVASSGNSGTGIVSRPAIHPAVIAVGATNFDGATKTFYSQHSTLDPLLGVSPLPGLPGTIELVAPVGDLTDLDGNGLRDAVIQETIHENNPERFDTFLLIGTSFSAPQVSAVAALLIDEGRRHRKDAIGVEVVRAFLRQSARDIGDPGPDLLFGAGQLDAGAAVTLGKITVCTWPKGRPEAASNQDLPASAAYNRVRNDRATLGACPVADPEEDAHELHPAPSATGRVRSDSLVAGQR